MQSIFHYKAFKEADKRRLREEQKEERMRTGWNRRRVSSHGLLYKDGTSHKLIMISSRLMNSTLCQPNFLVVCLTDYRQNYITWINSIVFKFRSLPYYNEHMALQLQIHDILNIHLLRKGICLLLCLCKLYDRKLSQTKQLVWFLLHKN